MSDDASPPHPPDRRWPGTECGHSDGELAERVAEVLGTSEELDASGLDVRVTGGVVALRGPASPDDRQAAVRVANSVRGVRDVRFDDPS